MIVQKVYGAHPGFCVMWFDGYINAVDSTGTIIGDVLPDIIAFYTNRVFHKTLPRIQFNLLCVG